MCTEQLDVYVECRDSDNGPAQIDSHLIQAHWKSWITISFVWLLHCSMQIFSHVFFTFNFVRIIPVFFFSFIIKFFVYPAFAWVLLISIFYHCQQPHICANFKWYDKFFIFRFPESQRNEQTFGFFLIWKEKKWGKKSK